MTAGRSAARGFGFRTDQSAGYHFEVVHKESGAITIREVFGFLEGGTGTAPLEPKDRAEMSPQRWELVRGTVATEFNARLKTTGAKAGRWLKKVTPLAPHFGKELVLLAWAIEDQDPTVIPRMLANWRGLAPEERWWFYTTIAASSRARANDQKHGWKAAIKIAFLDDPRDVGLESLHGSEPDAGQSSPTNTEGSEDTGELSARAAQGRLFASPDTK